MGLFALATMYAQQMKSPDLNLRGGRFKPLTYDQLSPAQKTLADHLLAGERGTLNGPFNVLLRSPEMGDRAQALGADIRFHSSLPPKLNEFAILIAGRYWNAQYEFYAHHKLAAAAGLSSAIVEALVAGTRPPSMDRDEQIIYDFSTELLNHKQVSDATFKSAAEAFGERGVVDLVGVLGYYSLVSMILNIDQYPLPEGEKPELKPAK